MGLSGGDVVTFVIEYNSVVDSLFTPIITSIRQSLVALGAVDHALEMNKLNDLVPDYKFQNYSRSAILPGEVVRHAIFQPELNEKFSAFFFTKY